MTPHAKSDADTNGSTSAPMTNGEKHHSVFLSHLTSYPLVSDSITTYQSHPYGAKSISVFNTAYSTAYTNLYAPFSSYLSRPYSVVAPYLAKADSIGDSGLSTLESRFPIVKADTATIQEKAKGVAGFPWRVVQEGKQFVFNTYDDELTKSEGNTIVKQVKAVVGTEIKLTMAVFNFVLDLLKKGENEAKEVVEKKKGIEAN